MNSESPLERKQFWEIFYINLVQNFELIRTYVEL
jgi:hypothetical protein